jgi:nitrous oxide reductase accessory protein NosL
MKNISWLLALAVMVTAGPALAAEADIEQIPACQYCGMDRNKFSSTRMLIEYEGGTRIGTCSIHDAAVDLAQSIGKTIKTIWAADYKSGSLIDAEKASWVVGGDLPGVMSKKSRVAFGKKAEAEAFQKEHGGTVASWDEAIDDSYDEMWADIKMIREKRAKMKKMKGMKMP